MLIYLAPPDNSANNQSEPIRIRKQIDSPAVLVEKLEKLYRMNLSKQRLLANPMEKYARNSSWYSPFVVPVNAVVFGLVSLGVLIGSLLGDGIIALINLFRKKIDREKELQKFKKDEIRALEQLEKNIQKEHVDTLKLLDNIKVNSKDEEKKVDDFKEKFTAWREALTNIQLKIIEDKKKGLFILNDIKGKYDVKPAAKKIWEWDRDNARNIDKLIRDQKKALGMLSGMKEMIKVGILTDVVVGYNLNTLQMPKENFGLRYGEEPPKKLYFVTSGRQKIYVEPSKGKGVDAD